MRLKRGEKKNPGGLETRTGGCRFCGQIANLEVPIEWTDEQVDEAAVECCGCEKAQEYTIRKKKKERAIEAIEQQFGEESETQIDDSIKELLIEIVGHVVDRRVTSGTIDIGNGLRAKIGRNAKGSIKVEREKKAKEVQEV